MPVDVFRVNAVGDFRYATGSSGYQTSDDQSRVGWSSSSAAANTAVGRMPVAIPRSAVINNAKLRIVLATLQGSGPFGTLGMINVGNQPAPSSFAVISTGVAGIINGQSIPSLGVLEFDVTASVQAIVNRGDWNSGQYMAFANTATSANSGNQANVQGLYTVFTTNVNADRPMLTIDWSPPPLANLDSSTTVDDNAASGATVLNFSSLRTAGSTIALSGADAANFAWNDGSSLLVTDGAITKPIGGVYTFTITETYASASNSPRSSTITVTVVEGYTGAVIIDKSTAITASTAGISIAKPPAAVAGDILIIVTETSNQLVPTPTDFLQVPGLPLTGGTGTTTSVTQLNAFYKVMTASEPSSYALADPGDHIGAIYLLVRGADTANPFQAGSVGSVLSTASTTVNWASITPAAKHTLLLGLLTVDTDIATARQNAPPSGWTEVVDVATTQGNGGGIVVNSLSQVDATATTATTSTLATSSRQARLLIGMNKKSDPAPPTDAAIVTGLRWH